MAACIEGQAHLADVVAQAHGGVAQFGRGAQGQQGQAFTHTIVQTLVQIEQAPAFLHPRVRVGVSGVGQRACQAVHQRLTAKTVVGGGGVQRPPQAGQAGQFTHGQGFHPGILQQGQQVAGDGHQRYAVKPGRRVDQVGRGMRRSCTVLLPMRLHRQVDGTGGDERRLAAQVQRRGCTPQQPQPVCQRGGVNRVAVRAGQSCAGHG